MKKAPSFYGRKKRPLTAAPEPAGEVWTELAEVKDASQKSMPAMSKRPCYAATSAAGAIAGRSVHLTVSDIVGWKKTPSNAKQAR